MNGKLKIKVSVDILMIIAMFILMCYPYTGVDNHEIAGTVLLVLFTLHQILNINWYKNLINGKYKAPRIFQLVVDVGLLIVIFLQMLSGISMSGYVFIFLPFGLSVSVSRIVHMVCAYAGFLLMSFHAGLHYGMIINFARKISHLEKKNKYQTAGLRVLAGGIAVYGMYALVKRDFFKYISMQIHFAFFDYEEPVVLFVMDYFCIMGMMVFLAYYLQKCLVTRKK